MEGVVYILSETYMLSTVDNPYSPFDQFDQWFIFDVEHGYNSCGYLARIAPSSNQFTDEENKMFTEDAIDQIIKYDFMNVYRKVKRSDYKI